MEEKPTQTFPAFKMWQCICLTQHWLSLCHKLGEQMSVTADCCDPQRHCSPLPLISQMPAAPQSPREVALQLAVPWLNSILLQWGVQRTGGRMRQKKRRCFLITNQIAWLTSKDKHTDGASRAWSEVREEPCCCEIEKKKPCQGKNIRQKKLMHWDKTLFSSTRVSFPPSHLLNVFTHITIPIPG